MARHPISIGTILLERNRWLPGETPDIAVVDWLRRFSLAGFDGMELWEKHYTLAPEAERASLRASPFRVSVYNTYARFSDSPEAAGERECAAAAVRNLGAAGVKFNLGPDEGGDFQVEAARQWGMALPDGVRLLCECHAGTLMERPERAAEVFDRWGAERFQAIVHPFLGPPGELEGWMRRLGPRITHAHVQSRDANGNLRRLDRQPAASRDVIHRLLDGGFAGSFTLEFAEGTRTPEESPEMLFENALRDLAFLRENLS